MKITTIIFNVIYSSMIFGKAYSRDLIFFITTLCMLTGLVSCHSEEKETQAFSKKKEKEEVVMGVDSVSIPDTIDHSAEFLARDKFEWLIQAKNTNYSMDKVKLLKDSSFILHVRDEGSDHPFIVSRNFIDSKGQTIANPGSTGEFLLKLTKNGKKEWIRWYSAKDEYENYALAAFAVSKADKVVALISVGGGYFKKIEDEQYERQYGESDNPPDRPDNDTIDRSCLGLQFINNPDEEATIIPILSLDPGVDVVSFECVGKDRFVIAGSYFGKVLKDKPAIENTTGNFIAVVNSKGELLWYNAMQIEQGKSSFDPIIEVSDDGTIYFCSGYSGNASFKSGQKIKFNGRDAECYTYLISFSKDGTINWIKNNEVNSYCTALKSGPNGIFMAQRIYGNRIFNNEVDTTGQISEFCTLLDAKGNYKWSSGFPFAWINSIAIDNNGLPVVMGQYGGYSRALKKFSSGRFVLGPEDDLAIVRLNKIGTPVSVQTRKLDLRNDGNASGPAMLWVSDKIIYIMCNSEFISWERYDAKESSMGDQGNVSYFGKLK